MGKLGRQKYGGQGVNMSSKNPLSFLGLRRAGEESEEVEVKVETNNASPKMSKGGLQLNKRGIPARKRKLNSLIYGTDDLVSIPIKSPKKRGPKTPSKVDVENDVEDEDIESAPASPVKIVKKKASVKKTPKSSAKKSLSNSISLGLIII